MTSLAQLDDADYKIIPYDVTLLILSFVDDEPTDFYEEHEVSLGDYFGYFARDPMRKPYQYYCRTYETSFCEVNSKCFPTLEDEDGIEFAFMPKQLNIGISASEFFENSYNVEQLDECVHERNALLKFYVRLNYRTVSAFMNGLTDYKWSNSTKVIIEMPRKHVQLVSNQLLQLATLPIVEKIKISDVFDEQHADDVVLIHSAENDAAIVALMQQLSSRNLDRKVRAPYIITTGRESTEFWQAFGPRISCLDVRQSQTFIANIFKVVIPILKSSICRLIFTVSNGEILQDSDLYEMVRLLVHMPSCDANFCPTDGNIVDRFEKAIVSIQQSARKHGRDEDEEEEEENTSQQAEDQNPQKRQRIL